MVIGQALNWVTDGPFSPQLLCFQQNLQSFRFRASHEIVSLGTFPSPSGPASGVPYVLMAPSQPARWGIIYLLTTIRPADYGTQSPLGIITNLEVGFLARAVQGRWHAGSTPARICPGAGVLGVLRPGCPRTRFQEIP